MLRMGAVVAACCVIWLSMVDGAPAQNFGRGSTVEGDGLRGQGAFLSGAGWYNLRSAQANSVNVDATIRWKQDLRKIQQERSYQEIQKKYEKKQNVEELKRQIAQQKQELRTNPSPKDVQSGAALNALVYDLTDPDIKSGQWYANSIALPSGTSVKELVFSFTPHSVSTQASAALSRGVIALSRLDIKENWPSMLKNDELAKERKAYEDAYLRVRDKVLRGDYAVKEILALDSTLDGLEQKIKAEYPSERRGYRSEALNFVEDLRKATRMFDAKSVDYAREILTDTKDHDATTVQELVEFMSKYRLQFAATSERSPAAHVLYGQIYEALRKQADALHISSDLTPIPAPEAPSAKDAAGKWVSYFNGKNLDGWKGIASAPGGWTIRNGLVVGNPSNKSQVLMTERSDFVNFHLRIEAMIQGEQNAWVLARTSSDLSQPCYRVQLGAAHLRFRESGKSISRLQDSDQPPIKPGEWFTQEVIVKDGEIVVLVNGRECVNYKDRVRKVPPGAISINHAMGASLQIRRIEVMELTASK